MSAKAKASAMLIALLAAMTGCASMSPLMRAEYSPSAAGHSGTQPGATAATADLRAALDLAAELEYRQAAGKLAGLEGRFIEAGSPAQAAEAAFWLGFCYEKQGLAGRAAGQYRRVIDRYPGAPAERVARDRLSRLPRSAGP